MIAGESPSGKAKSVVEFLLQSSRNNSIRIPLIEQSHQDTLVCRRNTTRSYAEKNSSPRFLPYLFLLFSAVGVLTTSKQPIFFSSAISTTTQAHKQKTTIHHHGQEATKGSRGYTHQVSCSKSPHPDAHWLFIFCLLLRTLNIFLTDQIIFHFSHLIGRTPRKFLNLKHKSHTTKDAETRRKSKR